jgi:uncharacterized coiled-coil DUF342 family protein
VSEELAQLIVRIEDNTAVEQEIAEEIGELVKDIRHSDIQSVSSESVKELLETTTEKLEEARELHNATEELRERVYDADISSVVDVLDTIIYQQWVTVDQLQEYTESIGRIINTLSG